MKIKEKKILVTGGAGFIGSHLVRKLLKMDKQVGVIDDLSRGNKGFVEKLGDKISFYDVDLRKEDGLLEIFNQYELIFNLAALNTGVDYDKGRTEIMFENNMLLQMIPLRVASKSKTIKKFIQVSSASVYSREAMENQVPTPEEADTNDPEPSKLGYALAKKMGENLASWYAANTDLKTVSARFINVYGENDHFDDLGHFIPMMIRKVIKAKNKINVFGSGNQKRSFMYVGDAVNGLLVLAESGENGQAYNIDSGEEKSVKEVVNLIIKNLNKKLIIDFDLTKPEGSQRRMLDSSKIRSLGWVPETTFLKGIDLTIKDILNRINNNEN